MDCVRHSRTGFFQIGEINNPHLIGAIGAIPKRVRVVSVALNFISPIHIDSSQTSTMLDTSVQWTPIKLAGLDFTDIRYEIQEDGIVKMTICRPEKRNAFRPRTLLELEAAFIHARDSPRVLCVILTGEGPDAFCSGGDQSARGHGGYVGTDKVARLSVLDLHILIRRLPKPVIAMVAGYAVGGGHILHIVCDLTICATNARFGQTGPKVGSFDGGYGSSYLARIVGQKRAREIWFLCRLYDAAEAQHMGLVNKVVALEKLEEETLSWCRTILRMSPTAIACLKAALNADGDGHAGLSQLAGEATRLFYQSEEGKEGRDAFLEKRTPRFRQVNEETGEEANRTFEKKGRL